MGIGLLAPGMSTSNALWRRSRVLEVTVGRMARTEVSLNGHQGNLWTYCATLVACDSRPATFRLGTLIEFYGRCLLLEFIVGYV